ncbi:MAG TPA: biopolymer transporter ExbD [Spirochaetales bacterium]|nr:biopolymer transporter ExbD [Spirochaetales bacterium]
MNIKRRLRRKPFVPINSMSDIAFLLLIFIMLISLINYRQEIKIDYPEGEYQEVTQADKNLEIWVDRAGAVFYDGAQVTLSYLEAEIADAVGQDPSVRIHILADKNTAFRNVNGLLEILKLLQHRAVSLVVKDPSE